MKNLLLTSTTTLGLATLALAADVDLTITSGGAGAIQAQPGGVISYDVHVELSDASNEGLALLCFDLEFDGGALPQANPAAGPTQLNFATPLGLSNPAGYGGTDVGGKLVQVGGAQNTIKNTFAPVPTGTVLVGLATPGNPVLFVSGTLNAPAAPGTYHLNASQLIANVIRQGEDGSGEFWAVDSAGAGNVSGLVIEVLDCAPAIYCTAKVNSQGCAPSIAFAGAPTLSGPDDFHVTASNVLNKKFGVLFWGLGSASGPFNGGTLCVATPLQRIDTQNSSGSVSGNDCTGTFDQHISQGYMLGQAFLAGTQVNAQYFYRDPAHADGTGFGLTNAVEFTVCP
jgi:hypothetical protein